METGAVQDLFLPNPSRGAIKPHAIIGLPRSSGMELLLCYDSTLNRESENNNLTQNDC